MNSTVVMNSKCFKYLRCEGSSSRYCCVPFCRTSSRFNSVISFHCLPLDNETRSAWLLNIRRKNCKNAPNHLRVCSRHFKKDDYIKSSSPQGRRLLRKGAVPTLFKWNNYSTSSGLKRVGVFRKSRVPTPFKKGTVDLEHEDHNYYCPLSPVQSDGILDQTEDLRKEVAHLKRRVAELTAHQRFCLGRFAASDDDIRFYTRFATYNHLMAFWRLIQPASHNMVRVTRARAATTKSQIEALETALCQSLQPLDEFFLFMVHLSVGLTERDLAYRFNVHQTTVSQVITTWANFLYTILGSVNIWMSKEAVKAQMPKEFQDFPDTQIIIDFIELWCQSPSYDQVQDEGSHCTFKGLIGMAPHGAVTFVSSLYAGSLSDKEVLKKSGIMLYLKPEMAIMVKKYFLGDVFLPCKVYRPAYLSKGEQMSAGEEVRNMREAQSIAQLRVHVDRLICRVKQHKLLDTVVPFTSTRTINQLYIVACLLINYQNGPLLKGWAKG